MLRQFIARIRNVAVVFAAATALCIAPLTACGVKGPLKLPPPPPAATGAAASSPETPPAVPPTEPPAAPAPKPPEPKP